MCNTRAGECRVTDMKGLVWKFTDTEDANREVDLAIWLVRIHIDKFIIPRPPSSKALTNETCPTV